MFQKIYYEEYEAGMIRGTTVRTITETDIVVHAGQTVVFFLITWMLNGAKRNPFSSAWYICGESSYRA